ncbi:MAG: AI-2E family transporter, partial [Desulfovibrio sp.]|nr:AI-2E family transporter [Desulfovibrio sp.]
GLLFWGSFGLFVLDNVCRTMFLSQGIKAPFIVLILVIVCGVNIFGPIGIVAAPTLFAIALELFRQGDSIFTNLKNH